MGESTDLTYYYKDNKGRLREQARGNYKNLSEEEKNKKRIWEE